VYLCVCVCVYIYLAQRSVCFFLDEGVFLSVCVPLVCLSLFVFITCHLRPYGVDPYGSYYTDPRILFPVENKDDRLPLKTIIIGFHQGNIYKAYNQKDVESSHVINDKIFDKSILLISQFSGNARAFDRTINDQVLEFDYLEEKLIDLQTKSEWSYEGVAVSGSLKGTELIRTTIDPGFWFAWAAFHPDTDLFGDVRN